MIAAHVEYPGLDRAAGELAERASQTVVAATNAAARWASTEINRRLRKYVSLRAGSISRRNLALKLAGTTRPEATLTIGGRLLPLSMFRPRMTGKPPRPGGGTSVEPTPGERFEIAHAFLATVRGKRGVFIRNRIGPGSDRRHIRRLYHSSVPEIFLAMVETISGEIYGDIRDKLVEETTKRMAARRGVLRG
jgi:hypothetical protein